MERYSPEDREDSLLIQSEKDDGSSSDDDFRCRSCNRQRGDRFMSMAMSALFCLTGLTFYLISIPRFGIRPVATTAGLERIANTYHTQQFDGGIFLDTPFKGPPSDEVDAAWMELTPMAVIRVSRDEIVRAGGSEASVQLADEYGGGYQAYLELPHQIHCLYELWKNTWPTYYNSTAKGNENPDSIFRKHLDHCADLLRQKLLCDADTTIMTYNYVKHLSHPTPNFNTVHQCRNATAVLEWYNENKVDLPREAFKKPANATELETFP